MKNKTLSSVLLTFALIATTCANICANPVDPNKAKKAASMLLQAEGMKKASFELTDITAATPFSEFYVFAINGGEGFVVIAGDDQTEPILAYSLNNPFPAGEMPAHIRAWYDGYEMEIRCNRSESKSSKPHWKWEQLLSGNLPSSSKDNISPIISTQWDQSPYYNELCPYDTANRMRPPCGCTATATAQIMKAFNHPATGYGSETFNHYRYGTLFADYGATNYDWDNMPRSLSATSSETEVNAVATLIYHVGVSVHMNYQIGGSAGKTACYGWGGDPSSENAFKYNFRYSPNVRTLFRSDQTLDEWKAIMLEELENGRPILYAGYDELQSGHAFVCDGYRANTETYHFNWGWGGHYDAFYKLDNLNPTSSIHGPTSYHFDLFATATIGIEPFDGFNPQGTTTITTAVQPTLGANANDGTVTGAGTYQFGDTVVLEAIAANEQSRFVQWSDGCRYNPRSFMATGGDLHFTAQFAPVQSNTVRYHTCDNAMNRASNLPAGIGLDSVWGIKICANSIKAGNSLKAIEFMGRKEGHHTLTLMTGINAPEQTVYTASFFDSLDYPYTFYRHDLTTPITIGEGLSLWVVLKCTDVDTPGVFSIYGGNPNSMLVGDDLVSRGNEWKFSWMIEAIFDNNSNAAIDIADPLASVCLYPNPASSTVTLQGIEGNATIEVIDQTGRICLPSKSTATTPTGDTTLDISTLRPGCYMVRIKTETSQAVRKLIVK